MTIICLLTGQYFIYKLVVNIIYLSYIFWIQTLVDTSQIAVPTEQKIFLEMSFDISVMLLCIPERYKTDGEVLVV